MRRFQLHLTLRMLSESRFNVASKIWGCFACPTSTTARIFIINWFTLPAKEEAAVHGPPRFPCHNTWNAGSSRQVHYEPRIRAACVHIFTVRWRNRQQTREGLIEQKMNGTVWNIWPAEGWKVQHQAQFGGRYNDPTETRLLLPLTSVSKLYLYYFAINM